MLTKSSEPAKHVLNANTCAKPYPLAMCGEKVLLS